MIELEYPHTTTFEDVFGKDIVNNPDTRTE